jgi:hypothetical protein
MESIMAYSLTLSTIPTKAEVENSSFAGSATSPPSVGEFVVYPPAKLARKSHARSRTVRLPQQIRLGLRSPQTTRA